MRMALPAVWGALDHVVWWWVILMLPQCAFVTELVLAHTLVVTASCPVR